MKKLLFIAMLLGLVVHINAQNDAGTMYTYAQMKTFLNSSQNVIGYKFYGTVAIIEPPQEGSTVYTLYLGSTNDDKRFNILVDANVYPLVKDVLNKNVSLTVLNTSGSVGGGVTSFNITCSLNNDDRKPAGVPGCERHYQSAVKFIVDTPTVHPFTINKRGGSVVFSTGNLQYCPARDEWRFALRQFDRVGKGKSVYAPEGLKTDGTNINDNGTTVFYDSIDYSTKDNSTASGFKEIKGVPCNNTLVSKRYGGWVDMFAWGTSGQGRKAKDSLAMFFSPYDLNAIDLGHEANKFGYGPSFDAGQGPGAISNDIDVYSGTNRFFDWGYNNVIREYYNLVYDENKALVVQAPVGTMYRRGVWRTLTADEWKYILTTREVDGKDSAFTYVRLKYGKNNSDTVSGVLIYPDDFSFSEAGVASLPFGATYGVSEIDATMWEALEEVGVVFLPTAYQAYPLASNDNHMNLNDGGLGQMGFYWSSTASDGAKAEHVRFDVRNQSVLVGATNRIDFISVRLVQDFYTPPITFSVGETQKVAFSPGNLQYQGSTKTWRFAPTQYDRCMANNENIAANYDGWIDLFAWGTGDNPIRTSTKLNDYNNAFIDWGTNKIDNYPEGTWRTPTKDDWVYLFTTRQVNGGAGYSYVTLKYGPADADTATGCLIYPDDFTWEDAGITTPLQVGASAGVQVVQQATWKALEKEGCAFLPACTWREGTEVTVKNYGSSTSYYWSSTIYTSSGSAYSVRFNFGTSPGLSATWNMYRYYGYSVRLVRDL